MGTPYLSEIKICSFNYPPRYWALCNGQFLAINQNQALFSLLGTTYGGNGTTNFALPNLQGRVPIHAGNGHTLGEQGGEQNHTLNSSELPAHIHSVNGANNPADTNTPTTTAYLGQRANTYNQPSNLTAMAAGEISNSGGSQAHVNMQPYLGLNFCIALQGIFPSP